MANGRVWMKCTSCREGRLLAKTWPGRVTLWPTDKNAEDFDEWMLKHLEECHDNHTGQFAARNEPFDLDFE